MRLSTYAYRRGIQSLYNFTGMLQEAMYEALQGVDEDAH